MAAGALSIKLRCASWQQLATIYYRDLSRGTMFLKASNPPAIGTSVRIDLTLPSSSVIVLTGTVHQHVNDTQRGAGVELKLAPIPTGSVWMIESALASEARRESGAPAEPLKTGPVPTVTEGADVSEAEAELIRALTAEAESMKKLNPFLVLGVSYEVNDGEVRAAFGELTKKYHPDRFARYESTQLRSVAAEIFILIRDAYRKLGDAAGRTQALAAINKPPTRAATANPVMQQRRTPPQGVPSLSGAMPRATTDAKGPAMTGSIPRAAADVKSGPIRALAATVAQTPQRPDPHEAGTVRKPPEPALLDSKPGPTIPIKQTGAIPAHVHEAGTVRKPDPTAATPPPMSVQPGDTAAVDELIDAGKFEDALVAFRMLAKKHPNERVYRAGIELAEGLKAMAVRDRLEAAQRFEAALEIDPSNERAARELAEMRRQATNERKGLLSRLMGKKE
jgi:hypothetical protein